LAAGDNTEESVIWNPGEQGHNPSGDIVDPPLAEGAAIFLQDTDPTDSLNIPNGSIWICPDPDDGPAYMNVMIDGDWLPVGIQNARDIAGSLGGTDISVFANGVWRSQLYFDPDKIGLLYNDPVDSKSVRFDITRSNGRAAYHFKWETQERNIYLGAENPNDPITLEGTDFSSLPGIRGDLFMRNTPFGQIHGQLWICIDNGVWSRIGSQASFVNPSTATAQQIAQAMIDSGLMAES
jgi:hypothetical protein